MCLLRGVRVYLIHINPSRLLSLPLPEGRSGTAWNLQGSEAAMMISALPSPSSTRSPADVLYCCYVVNWHCKCTVCNLLLSLLMKQQQHTLGDSIACLPEGSATDCLDTGWFSFIFKQVPRRLRSCKVPLHAFDGTGVAQSQC